MAAHGLVAISAFVLTMLLMPSAIRLAGRFRAIDQPDSRKVHSQAIPRLGGVGFVLAFVILSLLTVSFGQTVSGVLAGLLIIFLVGFLDDIRPLSPKAKFLGQIAATLVFVLISGASLTSLGDLFGLGSAELGWFAIPFTLFAMVGVINAMNLSDGLDGLASGLSIIALIFMGFFALRSGHEVCFQLILIFLFCLFGFLYFNNHPARVFMGDCGSMSIGFFLAAMAVLLVQSGPEVKTQVEPVSMVMILGLPIVDTLLVMTRRVFRGEHPFSPDKSHLHHQLMQLGVPHSGVVGVMYTMMLLMGAISVFWLDWPPWQQFYAALLLVSCVFVCVPMVRNAGFKLVKQVPDAPGFFPSAYSRSLLRFLGRSEPWVTRLMLFFLLAASVMVDGVSAEAEKWLAFLALFAVVMYPIGRQSVQTGMVFGVIYMLVLGLLGFIHFYSDPLVVKFTNYFSLFLLLWVLAKFSFQRHGHVVLNSGFEVLILIIVFVLPWLGNRLDLIDAHVLQDYRSVALMAIPWLLACKIVLRRLPRRNLPLFVVMTASVIIILLKSIMI